jgi:hypothetical protein
VGPTCQPMRERDEGTTAREALAHGESINLQGRQGVCGPTGFGEGGGGPRRIRSARWPGPPRLESKEDSNMDLIFEFKWISEFGHGDFPKIL